PARPAPQGDDAGTQAATGKPLDGGSLADGSLNGDPRGPTAEALNVAIRGAGAAVQRCLDAAPDLPHGVELRIVVGYRVTPGGHAENVTIAGPLPPGAAACVRGAVETLPFPAFEGR